MKKQHSAVVATLLLLQTLLFSTVGTSTTVDIVDLDSVAFAKQLRSQSGTLLDVRRASEFAGGHLPGAGQLDYYMNSFHEQLLLLPRDQPIYLYCNTGWRSRRAAKILAQNGYSRVYNLENGIMDWQAEDLPVVIEPDASPNQENAFSINDYRTLIEREKRLLIDFYAPWCGPCRQMMPVIDELAQAFQEHLTVVKINADASRDLMKHLDIRGVPHLVVYHEGQIVEEHTGLADENSLRRLFETGSAFNPHSLQISQ
ncbi:MAG: thioredoxin domain-containing protein [Oceanipulchritudo sp.]